jgi:hypothetical protein
MSTSKIPAAPIVDGVDVGWKIFHLTASIRSRERLVTFTGFATPHTPEAPAVIEARIAEQLEVIAAKRLELAHWESIAAQAAAAHV